MTPVTVGRGQLAHVLHAGGHVDHLLHDDDGPEPLIPPALPTAAEVDADPARSAVAAAVAVHLAQQLDLDDVAGQAVAVLRACCERLA